MIESIEKLILERLKQLQTGQDRIEKELIEIKVRLSEIGTSFHIIRNDLARQHISIYDLTERIKCIELTRASVKGHD